MSVTVEELESKARELSSRDRGELISRLIASLEGEPEGAPEEIAATWDAEVARRVEQMEAGRTVWFPAEQVREETRAIIDSHRK
ncbi:MAG: addiction module protein [Burkholderiales bacterium]|jgi:putative addiction module component (TIGR02574 family)|nr:addiction module protein [Burkholderiales bacterium]